ncbi:MAG TPA: site-2 protease family protein [Phycisphaerales bacterium]|nr:site-2 protease family protein [Phycisphaerales bacterium]HMP38000.1 site-2 protease family protein [Phycisphaerales bacterium]
MLLNVLAILGGFTLLIVVHELGHFLAARWAGIRVDGFAVGMGPTACSYRAGIGLVPGSTDPIVRRRFGRPAIELTDEELRAARLGETEYSLRWLPIGGFVKMLGQDDLHPTDAATGQRSYLAAPIGRRMIVVSAGVIANAALAVLLFMVAFMVGVRFEAPVLGEVAPEGPAAKAVATDASALGITGAGLRSGDRVRSIDGAPVRTFSDIFIAAAMAAPGAVLDVVVERPGVEGALRFPVVPERSGTSRLYSIGVAPASSTRLSRQREVASLVELSLLESGLGAAGVVPGAELISVGGEAVETWNRVERIVAASGETPLTARWTLPDGATVETPFAPRPGLEMVEVAGEPGGSVEFAEGLAGLVPLMRVGAVSPESLNRELLRPGDVVLGVARSPMVRGAQLSFPRRGELLEFLRSGKSQRVDVTILRDGVERRVEARTDAAGRLGVLLSAALELPVIARPIDAIVGPEQTRVATAIAPLRLLGGTRILGIGERPVEDWNGIWRALRDVAAAAAPGSAASITLTVAQPIATEGGEAPVETLAITLSPTELAALRALREAPPVDGAAFDPLEVTLTAGGNPIAAVAMGFRETHKMIVMTYLTIARLVQRTVGVDQLRGPVGIVHLGSTVIDHGWAYGLLFLAMISVNLAVLNFLPLPIVDGGLFLYLIYEKIRGSPPPVAFQNFATMIGLLLIGSLFVVTFYNDIARLIG